MTSDQTKEQLQILQKQMSRLLTRWEALRLAEKKYNMNWARKDFEDSKDERKKLDKIFLEIKSKQLVLTES